MSDRGVEYIQQRLRDEVRDLAQLERHATAARRRRDLLILKLLHAGLTERAVAPMAGVSNVMVHHIRVAARANPPEPSGTGEAIVSHEDADEALALFHPDLGPESLREVAAEIIRLYHSPAPIRENLDLIQRHGLAMAQALVEIDPAVLRLGADDLGRIAANDIADAAILQARSHCLRRYADAIDGSVAGEETTT